MHIFENPHCYGCCGCCERRRRGRRGHRFKALIINWSMFPGRVP